MKIIAIFSTLISLCFAVESVNPSLLLKSHNEDTPDLVDAKINFKDTFGDTSKNYPVKRYALASKSPYFHAMFTNGMLESTQGMDKPITIHCTKLNENVQQDFIKFLHQNKFIGKNENYCIYHHMLKMTIEHLLGLLELAQMCQVDMVKQGELALLEIVKRSKSIIDLNIALDYAKVYDSGVKLTEKMHSLLSELSLLRDTWTNPPKERPQPPMLRFHSNPPSRRQSQNIPSENHPRYRTVNSLGQAFLDGLQARMKGL